MDAEPGYTRRPDEAVPRRPAPPWWVIVAVAAASSLAVAGPRLLGQARAHYAVLSEQASVPWAASASPAPAKAAPLTAPPAENRPGSPALPESSMAGKSAAALGEEADLAAGDYSPMAAPAAPPVAGNAARPWRKSLDPMDTTALRDPLHGKDAVMYVPGSKREVAGHPEKTPMAAAPRVANVHYDGHDRETFSICACTLGPRVAGYSVDGKARGALSLGSRPLEVDIHKSYGRHRIVIEPEAGWQLKRYTIEQNYTEITSVAEYADGSVVHESWGAGAKPCPGH